ncbi:tyrosine-type recombinase/integrase [Streptomyces sp. NPDC048473]
MFHQFAHGGTISVPTDSAARGTRERVTCITRGPAEYNTADHLRRESRLCERTCSIATRSHPHTASADTSHTYATWLLRKGAGIESVKELLGHASITTTVDTYGHLTVEDARRTLEAAGWFTGREVRL